MTHRIYLSKMSTESCNWTYQVEGMDMHDLSVFLKSAPQEWDIVHIGTEEGVEVYMDFPSVAEAVEFKLKYL